MGRADINMTSSASKRKIRASDTIFLTIVVIYLIILCILSHPLVLLELKIVKESECPRSNAK